MADRKLGSAIKALFKTPDKGGENINPSPPKKEEKGKKNEKKKEITPQKMEVIIAPQSGEKEKEEKKKKKKKNHLPLRRVGALLMYGKLRQKLS